MDDELKIKRLKDPTKEITIEFVQGGATHDKLKNCYFYPTDIDGVYLLCSKHDENLAVVTNGQPFMFDHDGLIWKVPNPEAGSEPFQIDNQAASGSWWNNNVDITGEDGGTFTAQASGGADGDADASYAAAN